MGWLNNLITLDGTGLHFPDYPTLLQNIQDQYRNIYGQDVYLEADSQDGQMLALQAEAANDLFFCIQAIFASYSPALAIGDSLSINVKINGISRSIPTNSTVDLVIVGQYGTQINNGSVIDILNQVWNLPAVVNIPESGQVTVTATSKEAGAFQANANTVTTIGSPTRGWQSVTNPAAAVLGKPVETDWQLRVRQANSVSLPSISLLDSMRGQLLALDGVEAAIVYQNDTGVPNANGMPPASIACIVQGGDINQIANTIVISKGLGVETTGTTTVQVADQGGEMYDINFYRPELVPIYVTANIKALDGFYLKFQDDIKAAVVNYFARLKIGQDVRDTSLYVPVYQANLRQETQTYEIINVLIGTTPDVSTADVPISFTQLATVDINNIIVNVSK